LSAADLIEVLEKMGGLYPSAAWVAANFFSQSLELGSAANAFFRPKAVQAIARAKSWAVVLSDEKYVSVEELAASAKLHAKVVRNELRLAFLSPDIVDAVLNGSGGFGLRDLRKCAALNWRPAN
jgi:hypothetical protein